MFFKRASKTPVKPALGSVQTIPEIFYGGGDPEADLHSAASSKLVIPSSVVSGSSGVTGSSAGRTKLIASLMISIFIIVSVAAGWFYWKYLNSSSSSANLSPTITTQTPSSTVELVITEATSTAALVTIPEIIAPTSTPIAVPTTSSFVLSELTVDFPVANQLDASDFDSDALTDLEEDIYGTDQSIFDTDKDGYSDGQEVLNLFNPKGTDPVRLAESGLVREFTHPRDTYRLYYPIAWQVGSVDAQSNTMLFTAVNGDYIEVRVFAKNNGEDFPIWFNRVAKNEKITDLQIASNNCKTSYYKRKDGLVMYVDMSSQVLMVIYHPLVNAPINYRTTLQMIMESVRIPGVVNAPVAL